MKITRKQLRQIILESLSDEQITLYSFVPKKDIHSIMKYGLAGSKGIVENPEMLDSLFTNEEQKQEFVDRYDPSDITLQGPSVLFQRVPMEYIVNLDSDHILSRGDHVLIEIDWSRLSQDIPEARVHGLELVPYDDEEYESRKPEIERELDHDEIEKFSKLPYHYMWQNYVPGYFAGNVPHGVIILNSGIISPEYLTSIK